MNKEISIFVNQIGYLQSRTKTAFVTGVSGGENFSLLNEEGKIVYTAQLKAPVQDNVSGMAVCAADFSNFNEAGIYTIQVKEVKSFPFKIGTQIFNDLYYSILKYFYLSRCGQEIEGDLWSHSPCHTGIADIYGTEEKKQVLGGWHDAGDYGRYIVAGSKAVMDMLLAYEAGHEKYNAFDILEEVRFELEWMLQMQREDGGVYHKISCYHFCSFISPEKETDRLVLAPVSTSATADFAGCLAYASQFYQETDKEFAVTLVNAALKAQSYLDSHEDELYKNPEEITTGGYGDWNVKDERYFALCALFSITNNEEYLQKAVQIRKEAMAMPYDETIPWKRPWAEAFGWGSVGGYGTEILIKNADKIKDKDIVADLKNAILSEADRILSIVEKASFKTGFGKVFWGSNGHACDLAHALLIAHSITKQSKYFEAAQAQLNYILGCNPMNVCYVTGNGTNTVENPHHRPSGAVGSCMPGMLSGGPSEGLMDVVAKEFLQGKAPLQCFIDKVGSYSTNEVAIYWNSAFVYLVANIALG